MNDLKRRHKYNKTTVTHLKEEYFNSNELQSLILLHGGKQLDDDKLLDEINLSEQPVITVCGIENDRAEHLQTVE
jgi:hypothetical protein